MLGQKLRRLGILAAPAALTLMATSGAKAYNTYYPFNTSASVETNGGGDYGISPTASPEYLNTRLDYQSGTTSQSTGWANVDHTGDGGGSLGMSIGIQGGRGSEKGAFTTDLWWSTQPVSAISFYIEIAPGSVVSGAHGASYAAGSSGFFQPVTRNSSYGFNNIPANSLTINGISQGTSNGWNFGDPQYTGTSDQGTWDYVQIQFPTTTQVRGMTFQDYDDGSASGRLLPAGSVTWYIDDLTFTPPVVPEPATLGLLGLSVPALLLRRRKHA